MRKINKFRIIIISLISMGFILTYFIMFYYINALYPQNKRIIYKNGEPFVTQNAEFLIKDAVLLSMRDIQKDKGLIEILQNNSGYLSEKDLNFALIQIVVKNPTKDDIKVDLTAFHLESGSFSLQFYYPLVMYYNNCGMYVNLSKGEEKELKIPVPISSGQFLSYNAENIKNRDYYLVCALYPQKIMAEIKLNNAVAK